MKISIYKNLEIETNRYLMKDSKLSAQRRDLRKLNPREKISMLSALFGRSKFQIKIALRYAEKISLLSE